MGCMQPSQNLNRFQHLVSPDPQISDIGLNGQENSPIQEFQNLQFSRQVVNCNDEFNELIQLFSKGVQFTDEQALRNKAKYLIRLLASQRAETYLKQLKQQYKFNTDKFQEIQKQNTLLIQTINNLTNDQEQCSKQITYAKAFIIKLIQTDHLEKSTFETESQEIENNLTMEKEVDYLLAELQKYIRYLQDQNKNLQQELAQDQLDNDNYWKLLNENDMLKQQIYQMQEKSNNSSNMETIQQIAELKAKNQKLEEIFQQDQEQIEYLKSLTEQTDSKKQVQTKNQGSQFDEEMNRPSQKSLQKESEYLNQINELKFKIIQLQESQKIQQQPSSTEYIQIDLHKKLLQKAETEAEERQKQFEQYKQLSQDNQNKLAQAYEQQIKNLTEQNSGLKRSEQKIQQQLQNTIDLNKMSVEQYKDKNLKLQQKYTEAKQQLEQFQQKASQAEDQLTYLKQSHEKEAMDYKRKIQEYQDKIQDLESLTDQMNDKLRENDNG